MNNLLGQALNFLLKPESELSYAFLAIFFLCFLYGIYTVFSCFSKVKKFKEEAVEEYKKVRNKMLPGEFIESFNARLSVPELKIEDLPNVFVSIGILGTFVGLGVAIQGAASLLSTDKVDLAKLNAVLEIIAFKFQTSVWGTCFSLVFSKFIAEVYFAKKQEKLIDIREKLYEEEISTRTTLESQLEELKNMQDNFNKYVEASGCFVRGTNNFIERVEDFKEKLSEFHAQLLNQLDKDNLNLINEQEKFSRNHKLLIETLLENVKVMQDTLTDKVEIMQRDISSGQVDISKMQEGMWFRMERSLEVMQKIFVRSEDEYVRKAQTSFAQLLKDNLQKIHEEYIKEANNLGRVISKFDNVLAGVNEEVKTIHDEFVLEQSNMTKAREINFDKITKAMNTVVETANKTHELNYNTISKTMNEVVATERQHREKMHVIYSDMEAVLADEKESLEVIVKRVMDRVAENEKLQIMGLREMTATLSEKLEEDKVANEVIINKLTTALKEKMEEGQKFEEKNLIALGSSLVEALNQANLNSTHENNKLVEKIALEIANAAKQNNEIITGVQKKVSQNIEHSIAQNADDVEKLVNIILQKLGDINLNNNESINYLGNMISDKLKVNEVTNKEAIQEVVKSINDNFNENNGKRYSVVEMFGQIASNAMRNNTYAMSNEFKSLEASIIAELKASRKAEVEMLEALKDILEKNALKEAFPDVLENKVNPVEEKQSNQQ